MEGKIFISYSRKNLSIVEGIKCDLEDNGFSCWMDLENIESGEENFKAVIIPAINGAKVLLFFLTIESQQSPNAVKEIKFAKNKGKRVILVRTNDDPLTDEFLFDFSDADTIDWRSNEQREKLFYDLADMLGVDIPSVLNNANKLYSEHKYQQAVCLYRRCADRGNDEAKCRLGRMFLMGEGIERNYRMAERLFRDATRSGYARAWFFLGRMHEQLGEKAVAATCYEAAAKLGDKDAPSCVARIKKENGLLYKVTKVLVGILKFVAVLLAVLGFLMCIAILAILLKLGVISV